MDCITLTKAVANIAAVEQAGLLSDFLHDVAAERRGLPRGGLRRPPYVDYMAQTASRVFELPLADCTAAAVEALVPKGRHRVVLDMLDMYVRRIEGQAPRGSVAAQATEKNIPLAVRRANDHAATYRPRGRKAVAR